MEEIKNVKGTHDIFGEETNAYEKECIHFLIKVDAN